MQVTKIRIDGQFFYLHEDVDIPALKEEILQAAAGPPAFITFRTHGYGEVSVLMGPQFGVRFQTEDHSVDEVTAWEWEPPVADDFHFLPEATRSAQTDPGLQRSDPSAA
ncbi:hypothetical protein [Rathayibacter sp. VKM Ac-2857]|uniref:hypothetical protein n=1 Tax=Rathayibacter sp. VKM Ac-2857 TaxID=2739020 RepID=UPI00156716BA|nr:hypothetical protein [Rathayibacter sp. VKM Ac-2857]NQX18329.1 hypothetical protein [Rathayibacter sp. VKM Ac-2857]